MFDPPPKIGACIYCGNSAEKLSDEHIIPYGLNGNWKLLDASCESCAKITSKFERVVLRDALLATRAALGFRSYRKLPKTLPLQIDRGEGAQEMEVAVDEHPAVAVLPRFARPSWLDANRRSTGVDLIGASTVYFGRQPLSDFVEKYRGSKLTGTLKYEPVAFARMVAKIALGYCAGIFGVESIRESYLIPAILGTADDIGTWVGSTDGYPLNLKPEPDGRVTHVVGTDVWQGDIVAYVRLFSWAVPDEYIVIVGPVPSGHSDKSAQHRQSL